MWTMVPWAAAFSLMFVLSSPLSAQSAASSRPAAAAHIPPTHATALDGHPVDLPGALPGRATVLILGFGRHSEDATTAWEKPVRTQLAHTPAIGFYDMAMLAEIPSFAHSFALRSIRKKVPDVLKPNFLPIFDGEAEWKTAVGYVSDQSEAAYVLLVDSSGAVRWSTHEAFTPAGFNQLRELAQRLAKD